MSTAPRRLGKYELQQPLGRGNMGEVWKARDLSTHGDVAIKILHSDFQSDPHFMTRFSSDGRTIAALKHENIVPVHEFMVTRSPQSNETTAYISMDYIEGPTLAHFIRATSHRGNIPSVAEIVYLFQSIGSALDYAHQQGIIHGNLKPENILLHKNETSRFQPGEPLLIDLGLTQILHTTGTVGAPFYVSPEQAKGLPATNRSDIYALGVMLYEICTSVLPFRDENSVTVMMQHINTLPTPPILINPGIPPALSEVILRAMGKDAANRFYSASFLASAIADACSPQSVLQMTKRTTTEGDHQTRVEEKTSQAEPTAGAQRVTTNHLLGVSQPLPAVSKLNSLGRVPAVPSQQARLFQGPTPLPDNRSQAPLPPQQQMSQETKSLPVAFQPAPAAPDLPLPPQRQYYQQAQPAPNQQQSYYQQQGGPASLPPLPANIDMSVPQLWEAPLPKSSLPQTPANPPNAPRNPSNSRRSKSFLNVTDTPIYMVVGLLVVLLVVITSAIAASLWINNNQAATPPPHHATILRQAFFEDDALGQSDQLRIDVQNMSAAGAGNMYFAWLQTSDHQFQPLGALTVQKGEGTLTYPGDSKHTNLLSITQGITITLEKSGANPTTPGNKNVFQATFSASILPYLKNLLYTNTDLPDQQGAVNGLFETIKSMNDKAVSIVDSIQNSHDNALARRQATRIIEMIDGTQYALASGDRPAAIPSETNLALGLLSSPNQSGYIDYVDKQLTAIQQTQTDNPTVLQHAQNVKNAVADLRNWIQKIRTYDVQILKAANLSDPGVLGVALQLKQAAADSYTGHTIPPNSNPSSDLNSAGAYQGFIETHYLATLTLQPGD